MTEEQGSGLREARSGASKGLSGANKAKAAASKGHAIGGKLFLLLVVLFLLGALLGGLSLLDPYMSSSFNIPRAVLIISALGSLSIGTYLANRFSSRPEDERHFWGELGLASLSALAVSCGMALMHLLLPEFLDMGSSAFAWSVAPTAVAVLLPILLIWAFRAAMEFEPRRYELWYYPKNYREQQHSWNRDRIVIANFHFKRKQQEDILTTVNVKLPEDAELGELAYLFIKDYNENRFPNNPITGLRNDDGSVGWLFRKPRYVLQKQRKWPWTEDILDPKKTIAQNNITRDCDVFFERVFQEPEQA